MADSMIDALLRERAGYVARGLTDRVAQVDAQLDLRGYVAPVADEAPQPEPVEVAETEADTEADDAADTADDQPEPVEPKRTAAESKPRRRA